MVASRYFKSALIAALSFAAPAYPGQAQPVPQAPAGNAVPVTADNFNRAETDMYFGKRVERAGIGNLSHSRELYLTDSPVVRPNRDTLYSGAVFDYDAGRVTITLPDAGNRFMSMQVIDEDQYTHAVYYGAGRYTMTREEMDTRYGSLVIRILANPKDTEDMKQLHALQDAIKVEQKSSGKYDAPNFDPVSQKKVRDALLALGTTILDNKRMFGDRTDVDPVRHLIGSAMLWGGLPETLDHAVRIDPVHGRGRERPGAPDGRAEQGTPFVAGDAGGTNVLVEECFELVMGRHLVTFAAFFVEADPPALAVGKIIRIDTTAPMRAKA